MRVPRVAVPKWLPAAASVLFVLTLVVGSVLPGRGGYRDRAEFHMLSAVAMGFHHGTERHTAWEVVQHEYHQSMASLCGTVANWLGEPLDVWQRVEPEPITEPGP